MPVTKKLVAQNQDDCQALRVNASSRFIVVNDPDWQFLFGPSTSPVPKTFIVKIGAEFNADTFDTIRLVSYLYSTKTGAIENASSCRFDLYKAEQPGWKDTFLGTFTGTFQGLNSYYFSDVNISSLVPSSDFLGETTILVESTMRRLGVDYKERLYVNHIGIYNNCFRLRQDVDFLDLIKQDE